MGRATPAQRQARGGDRVVWAALAMCCAFVVGASFWLSPSPSGVGTHEQLGLPPCGFLEFTGHPCPACGLTTAFAHLARLEVVASLRAHPLGLPLFALAGLLWGFSLEGLLRGRSVTAFIDRTQADRVAWGIAGGILLTWVVRLISA